MNEEKPLEEAAKEFAKELARQLYPDAKAWVVSAVRWAKKLYKKTTIELYRSPAALLDALKTNRLQDGDRVTLECKPALFGPFLRRHFLSPLVGHHTKLRLGPPLVHPNPIMGLLAQATSQLMPVGLYPPIGKDVNQACLYPSDSSVCGFIGLMPGVNDLVAYIPALLSDRHTPYCNIPCHVTGVIRLIGANSMANAGFPPEIYEEIRQLGNIWFLDATADDSECKPLGKAVTKELWGGFYASGHLEIGSGKLRVDRAIEAFRSALKSEGFESLVSPNMAGRQEIMLFSKGFRICVDSKSPFYSLHMDSELAFNFRGSRDRFDRVCDNALKNIAQICKDDSVELRNSSDLDFTYTDGNAAYTVLKSLGAENVRDPLVIAIRDWHRRRGIE
jgi:hypothetical protein